MNQSKTFKEPIRVKLKFFFASIPLIAKIIIILMVIFSFTFVSINKYNLLQTNLQTLLLQLKDFLGLIGVIIGGLIAGGISYWLKKQETKTISLINKKETIYEPLFNDFLKMGKKLNGNPYPIYFETDHRESVGFIIPKITEWGKIKETSKYLEVPNWLKNKINQFVDDLEKYNRYEKIAREEMKTYLEQYYDDHEKLKYHFVSNLDHFYLKSVLLDDFDCFKSMISRSDENREEVDIAKKIWQEAKEELQELPEVQRLNEFYEQRIIENLTWITKELKKIIMFIESKYELQNNII